MSKIRVIHKSPVLNDLGVILSVVELAGPSSESKPTTGFANGSLFLETDTGKIFIFDEDDGWSEVETGGGGGGGSGIPDTPGTDGTYVLQNTVESGTGAVSWVKPLAVSITDGVMSSTFGEISDAFRSGRPVIVSMETSGEHNYSTSCNILAVDADEDNEQYRVLFIADSGNITQYTTSSRNGYPELD